MNTNTKQVYDVMTPSMTSQVKGIRFPLVDAHFWVVRDGEIIDFGFPEFTEIEKMHDCDSNKKNYIPAPEMTQQIMIAQFLRVLKTVGVIAAFGGSPHAAPIFGFCFQNSIREIVKNGGMLVFGSLGFKKNNNVGFYYEWGCEDYKIIAYFIKR